MKEEPQYNEVYYQNTTSHSEIMDVVEGNSLALKNLHAPIDWHQIFGKAHPVEIEIGFGKGRFLLEVSKENPHKNYIGVERAQKYVLITRDRFVKYLQHNDISKDIGLFENVRLVWTDANFLYPDMSLMRPYRHIISIFLIRGQKRDNRNVGFFATMNFLRQLPEHSNLTTEGYILPRILPNTSVKFKNGLHTIHH